MTDIKPNFSNGTEFMWWLEGKCDGCSRNKQEPNWCPLQTGLFIGTLTQTQAKNMGFDKDGNPPKELKCWRKYTKQKKDKRTRDLFNEVKND